MHVWHLEHPWALILLLLLPALLWLRWRRPYSSMNMPTLPFIHSLRRRSDRRLWAIEVSYAVAFIAFTFALARPQSGTVEIEDLTEGVDIMLTMDTSGSMQAMDFVVDQKRIDRLRVVQEVAAEFVRQRPHDRIGIVAFGENAITQCPPTLDHRLVIQFMDSLFIGMTGQGTAIGSAIAISMKRLEKLESASKVIILLTDGRNNAGQIDPLKAAELAKSMGIRIYTIGVGSNGVAPFPVEGLFGNHFVNRHVELDETTLKNIAEATDGVYFNARDSESLRNIYGQINALEKSEIKTREFRNFTELYHLFIVPGLFALLLGMLIEDGWIRRLP